MQILPYFFLFTKKKKKNYRYTGQVQDVSQLEVLLDPSASTSMVELSKLVSFLVLEIDSVFPMDDKVNAIERPDEADMFCMELSSVLSELCNYKNDSSTV